MEVGTTGTARLYPWSSSIEALAGHSEAARSTSWRDSMDTRSGAVSEQEGRQGWGQEWWTRVICGKGRQLAAERRAVQR